MNDVTHGSFSWPNNARLSIILNLQDTFPRFLVHTFIVSVYRDSEFRIAPWITENGLLHDCIVGCITPAYRGIWLAVDWWIPASNPLSSSWKSVFAPREDAYRSSIYRSECIECRGRNQHSIQLSLNVNYLRLLRLGKNEGILNISRVLLVTRSRSCCRKGRASAEFRANGAHSLESDYSWHAVIIYDYSSTLSARGIREWDARKNYYVPR